MVSIYLWSKFSSNSVKILTSANKVFGLQSICIDHPVIRKKIESSTKIIVKSVPCILEIQDTKILQYEDNLVLKWLTYKLSAQDVETKESKEEPQVDTQELKFSIGAGPYKNTDEKTIELDKKQKLKLDVIPELNEQSSNFETKSPEYLPNDVTSINNIAEEPEINKSSVYNPSTEQNYNYYKKLAEK